MELITENGIEPAIVEYLRTPPDAATILRLAKLLDVAVADLLRRGEAEFQHAADLPGPGDDAGLAAWIAANPKVLQRPIVVNGTGDKAVIGRPPENVLELLPG